MNYLLQYFVMYTLSIICSVHGLDVCTVCCASVHISMCVIISSDKVVGLVAHGQCD